MLTWLVKRPMILHATEFAAGQYSSSSRANKGLTEQGRYNVLSAKEVNELIKYQR